MVAGPSPANSTTDADTNPINVVNLIFIFMVKVRIIHHWQNFHKSQKLLSYFKFLPLTEVHSEDQLQPYFELQYILTEDNVKDLNLFKALRQNQKP